MTRWTEEHFAAVKRRYAEMVQPKSLSAELQIVKSKSKYRAARTIIDGMLFDSKWEGEYYLQLRTEWELSKRMRAQNCGRLTQPLQLDRFMRKRAFQLPGNITLWVDFEEVRAGHGITQHPSDRIIVYRDTKGFLTQTSLNKIKQAEQIYGVEIELLYKPKRGARRK